MPVERGPTGRKPWPGDVRKLGLGLALKKNHLERLHWNRGACKPESTQVAEPKHWAAAVAESLGLFALRRGCMAGSAERGSAGNTPIVCCRPCSHSQRTVTASRDDRQMICNRQVLRTSRDLIMIVIRPRIRRRVPVGWASLSSP